MLEFMHSSTRSSSIMPPTNAINYHHHLAQSPVYHHYPAIKPKQKDVPPTSSAHRHHNHHNRQQNQPLQQKHRAKSVPNLDAPEIPQWITDSRTGVTYTIGQLLGRGGFGKCFLAYTNRQYFAMKVISRSHIKKHGNQISKIGREVQIHSSLCHPNIVALYSTFQCSQNIYMLLEYCPNRTLSEHIDQYHGIPESNAIVFMKQLLLAVRYLHEDCFLLHRDIKPGNILLSREWTVKLADFGFCCSIDELLSRPEHTVCGTPNYVAAEVIDKQGHTIYSDCWALACTFFAMLFGRPPFHCEHLHQTYSRIRRCEYSFPPDNLMVSESAKDLIRRTLIHRPEYRLKTPEMLAHSALNPKPLFNISSSSQSIANNLSNDFNAIFQQIEDTTPSTFSRLFINSNPIPQSMIQSESNTANCGINFGKNPLFQSPTKSFSKSTPLQNFSNFLPSMDFSTFAPNLGGNVKTTQFGGFGIDSGLGGSGSADSPNAIGGPLGKAVQFTLDKYIQTLQSVIDSFNPLNLVLMEHSSISAGADVLPSSFVAKWVDYTNKFGFGVTLRDGTRTILFNDQSSLSSTDNQRYFSFLANKFNDECIEWNYSEGFPRSDICDKVTFMRVLREYMDRELYSSVPINYQRQQSNNDFLMDLISRKQSKQRISASGMQQQFPLVHLIDYRKFPNALFIFLSDGTCQVNFTDTRYKLTMTMMPNQEEPDGISYQLYLITPKQKCFHFRTVNTFEFDQPAPPLSDDGWTLLRTFQRVLKSYHQSLNRNSLIYSTYC